MFMERAYGAHTHALVLLSPRQRHLTYHHHHHHHHHVPFQLIRTLSRQIAELHGNAKQQTQTQPETLLFHKVRSLATGRQARHAVPQDLTR